MLPASANENLKLFFNATGLFKEIAQKGLLIKSLWHIIYSFIRSCIEELLCDEDFYGLSIVIDILQT